MITVTDAQSYEITAGTTLTGTVNAAANDMVIALVTVRDTYTVPDGWTLLHGGDIFADSGNGQRVYFASKRISEAGTVSFTAVQATAQRLYLNLIALHGVANVSYNAAYTKTENSSSGTVTPADKEAGAALLWGVSCAYAGTASQWSSVPNDIAIYQLPATTNARSAIMFDNGSGAISRTMSLSGIATRVCYICALVLSQDHYATGDAVLSCALSSVSAYGSSGITWAADTPEGTSLLMYAQITDEADEPSSDGWLACQNGDELPCFDIGESYEGKTLWIKAALATTDTALTPSLSSVFVRVTDATDAAVLLLTLADNGRINNAEGDLTVAYDKTLGNLAGAGGAVESFSHTFTPASLEKKPNPNDAEHITAAVAASGALMRVYYIDSSEAEHISAAISATGTLISVSDI
jgi:hypothetical protein